MNEADKYLLYILTMYSQGRLKEAANQSNKYNKKEV